MVGNCYLSDSATTTAMLLALLPALVGFFWCYEKSEGLIKKRYPRLIEDHNRRQLFSALSMALLMCAWLALWGWLSNYVILPQFCG